MHKDFLKYQRSVIHIVNVRSFNLGIFNRLIFNLMRGFVVRYGLSGGHGDGTDRGAGEVQFIVRMTVASWRKDLKIPQQAAIPGDVFNLSFRQSMKAERFFLSVHQNFEFFFGVLPFQQSFLGDRPRFRGPGESCNLAIFNIQLTHRSQQVRLR